MVGCVEDLGVGDDIRVFVSQQVCGQDQESSAGCLTCGWWLRAREEEDRLIRWFSVIRHFALATRTRGISMRAMLILNAAPKLKYM